MFLIPSFLPSILPPQPKQPCVLLVGFHLRHVPKGENRSITQMEYVTARKLGVDVLVFMADEKADWPADYLAELKRDAGIRRWRAELGERLVRGSFTPPARVY